MLIIQPYNEYINKDYCDRKQGPQKVMVLSQPRFKSVRLTKILPVSIVIQRVDFVPRESL